MRRRRESKPPRRPRVITWRLVVVSTVVGIVLAAVSVVVGDWLVDRRPGRWTQSRRDWRFVELGYTAIVVRDRTWLGDEWWVFAGAEDGLLVRTMLERRDGVVDAATDPRPPGLRWPLDAGKREARCVRVGWPLRAASRGRIAAADPLARETWGVWKADVLGREVSLSTRPIWPGLLGNTLFYAILAMLPIVLLRWRKLRRRATRGLCVACGYDLGEGVSACPECGLTKRSS